MFQALLFFVVITTTTTNPPPFSLLACIFVTETGIPKNSAMCYLQNDVRYVKLVRGLSGKYPAILNISRTGRVALI